MDLYLPIANLSVNALVIIGLGGLVGLLSGMFGVGGGFLTTPLLIFYGIPPTVAAASAASQVTGASVSGVVTHMSRGTVDFRMGGVLISGGVVGAGMGVFIFRLLQSLGQIDTVIGILYVLMLGGIGGLMAKESIQALIALKTGRKPQASKRRHHPLVAALPMRWRFYRSGLYISPLAPFLLGMATGILTMLLGVGGGFILVPAMLYVLRMRAGAVVGTSLFQIIITTAITNTITPTHIEQWFAERNWARSTIDGVIAKIGPFFTWCVRESYCESNPCKAVKRPRSDDSPPSIFTLFRGSKTPPNGI